MHLTGSPSGPSTPIHHPRLSSTTARESTSPPMTLKRGESGTRLPFPAGEYTSPPDVFFPSNSPPSSISSAMRPLSTTIPGLPLHSSLGILLGASYSFTSLSSLASGVSLPAQPKFVPASANRTASPTPAPAKGRGAQQELPPPPKSAGGKRQTSVSPTPRKWYTVALGGPIIAPPDEDEYSLNAASLFYTTAANTNANINTHTDLPLQVHSHDLPITVHLSDQGTECIWVQLWTSKAH